MKEVKIRMLEKAVFCCFLLVYIQGIRSSMAQVTESLRFPEKGDSCNVINLHCGAGQQQTGGQEAPRNPGPPGKMGPVGPIGPNGIKGETGIQGPKGQSGKDAEVEEIKADILKMLSATSCEELASEFGVNRTGYYLMRRNGTGTPFYNYCDFQIYEGVSTCEELFRRRSPVNGVYRFRSDVSVIPSFVFCHLPLYTCEQLQNFNGTAVSGIYTMSPQMNEYKVHCDFSSETAVTEVWHESMQEITSTTGCGPVGCYSWSPQYEVDANNILKIIENSHECKQYIKVRCKGMALMRADYGFHGWWVSRQGEKMQYWGGATSRKTGYCACGETGSCVENTYKCNCDQNDLSAPITQDDGFLTDKSKLPVRELKFGDMDDSGEASWHTLGKLECMGQA